MPSGELLYHIQEQQKQRVLEDSLGDARRGIEGAGARAFESVYKYGSLEQRQGTVDTLFSLYANAHPEEGEQINSFVDKIKTRYPQDQHFILHALKLAVVAHQYNEHTEKQVRKDNGIAYIFHPLAMADRMADDRLDWFCIAGSFMHDVSEDVKLGEIQKEAWLEIIKRDFNELSQGAKVGIDHAWNAGDLLAELVEGVTEKKMTFTPEQVKSLRETTLYKALVLGLSRAEPGTKHRKEPLSEETKEKIDQVVYTMQELFRKALTSPDHWRIFAIKILDVWHNLKSPKWIKKEKILRGKVVAGLAEYVGWYRMRSDIIYSLSTLVNVNSVSAPGSRGIIQQSENGSIPPVNMQNVDFVVKDFIPAILYGHPVSERVNRPHIPNKNAVADCALFASEFIQTPVIGWEHTDAESNEVSSRPSTPPIEILVPVSKEAIRTVRYALSPGKDLFYEKNLIYSHWTEKMRKERGGLVRLKYADRRTTNLTKGLFDRERFDAAVFVSRTNSYKLRLESNEPHILSFFQGTASPDQVPEAALFANRHEIDSKAWEYHVATLIGFMYENNYPSTMASRVMVVKIPQEHRIVFVDGDTKIDKVVTMLGQPKNDVYHIVHADGSKTPGKGNYRLREQIGKKYNILQLIVEVLPAPQDHIYGSNSSNFTPAASLHGNDGKRLIFPNPVG